MSLFLFIRYAKKMSQCKKKDIFGQRFLCKYSEGLFFSFEAIPFMQRHLRGPKWLQFAVGVLFSFSFYFKLFFLFGFKFSGNILVCAPS